MMLTWVGAVRDHFKEEANTNCLPRQGGNKLGCEEASNSDGLGWGMWPCCTTIVQEPGDSEAFNS